jgi:hypothetical protein
MKSLAREFELILAVWGQSAGTAGRWMRIASFRREVDLYSSPSGTTDNYPPFQNFFHVVSQSKNWHVIESNDSPLCLITPDNDLRYEMEKDLKRWAIVYRPAGTEEHKIGLKDSQHTECLLPCRGDVIATTRLDAASLTRPVSETLTRHSCDLRLFEPSDLATVCRRQTGAGRSVAT